MSTVLVIDDVQTERLLFGEVVKQLGHIAEYAADGLTGFDRAKELKPSLILLDVVMPGQDGFATCRKLKKDPETSKIPVVLITSKIQDSDKFWGQKQGCDAYLTKPVDHKTLTETIKRYTV